jgi:hypothetical protein
MITSGRFEIRYLRREILALQVCGFPDSLIEPVEREYSLCVDAGTSEALLQFRIDHLHRLIARVSAFDEASWNFALRVFCDRDRDSDDAPILPPVATEESPVDMWRDYCADPAYRGIRWQVYSEARSFVHASPLRHKPRPWTKDALTAFKRALDNYLATVGEAKSKFPDTERGSDSNSKGDNAADSANTGTIEETLGGPLTSAIVTVTGDSVENSAEHKESIMIAVEDDERSNATNTGTAQETSWGETLWSPQH